MELHSLQVHQIDCHAIAVNQYEFSRLFINKTVNIDCLYSVQSTPAADYRITFGAIASKPEIFRMFSICQGIVLHHDLRYPNEI